MGSCSFFQKKIIEEECFTSFWNSLNLKKLEIGIFSEKTYLLIRHNQETFFREFEEKIVRQNFITKDFIEEAKFFNLYSFSGNSFFKIFAIYFSFLLLCQCESDVKFVEAFKKFFELCNDISDNKSNLHFDNMHIITEYVNFYVYLVSAQTHKAFLNSKNADDFSETKNEFNSIYSQINRDKFINDLFKKYKNEDFSLMTFMKENFTNLNHNKVREQLKNNEEQRIKLAMDKINKKSNNEK